MGRRLATVRASKACRCPVLVVRFMRYLRGILSSRTGSSELLRSVLDIWYACCTI